MIDGSKKKNANIGWVLNFTICLFLKCSEIFLCFVLIDIHHEGVGKYVIASVRPKRANRHILWLWKREQKFYSYFKDSALSSYKGCSISNYRHVKEVPFVNERYTKWVPFLSTMVYNKVRGQTSGLSLPI